VSIPPQPNLIVVDIGSTLGTFTGPSVRDVLIDLCPWGHLSPAQVQYRVQSILHVEPELTEEVIARVCDALLINRADWPSPWPAGGFRPYPDTPDALATLAQTAPVVALSNLSVTGTDRIAAVERFLGQHLTAIYTSFRLRGRKPERWLWRHIAHLHDTTPEQIIHCGDRWIEDALGAADVGAHAVWIHDTTAALPCVPQLRLRERITVARDLPAAARLITNS
jgi:FMN hydrolase / 5-amino-6-(5-phospho-D-ribitylamino)uracil phosphatase